VLGILNSLYKTDPRATYALLHNRVPANKDLMEHPTLMVQCESDKCEYPEIGLMGVINGIIGNEGKIIKAVHTLESDEDYPILTGFVLEDL